MKKLKLAALLALLSVAPSLSAQTANPLRIFLDCESCDDDYTREETKWAEFVRDRTVADVHVLVTVTQTGSGGTAYALEFVGLGRFVARVDTQQFVAKPAATSDEKRQGLVRTLHLGLAPFAARTSVGSLLRVTYEPGDNESAVPVGADPWRSWVFEIGAQGSHQREQRQRSTNFNGSFEAGRVTPVWKSGIEIEGNLRKDRFELDDRTVLANRESYEAGGVLVRSLGNHWAAGAEATTSASTFENTRRVIRAAPAIEYSVWDYAEATRRQLTMQYSFGVSAFSYREETIFNRLRETRPTQTFVAAYDARQRWGSAEAELEYANYADDRKQYRLEFDGSLNLRITRGLMLEVGGRASQFRDQLSIAKRGATDEEVLLELRDLRTDYQLEFSVGLTFTFGSIFNSVVNPRFGSGPGGVLR